MARTPATAPENKKPVAAEGRKPRNRPADAQDVTEQANAEKAAADAAHQAELEAAAAKQAAGLQDLKGRLTDELHELTSNDAQSAIDARIRWVNIGTMLNEGRNLFIKFGKNEPDDKAFGAWIEENGFTALGQRPTRAAAMWLANVYHTKEDLYALFPTESKDGEPLRRSPRTLQAWVTEQIFQVFQDAWEADSENIAVAADADKDSRAEVAKSAMPNVYAALAEQIDSATAARDAANEKLTKAKGAERDKAMREFADASDRLEALELRKAILDQHNDDERTTLFARWKPKQKSVSFKDADVEEAAARLFALLSTHDEFSAVYEALGEKVAELQAKVDADAGDVEAEGGMTDTAEDDAEGDEGDGFEGDDFDYDAEDGEGFDEEGAED